MYCIWAKLKHSYPQSEDTASVTFMAVACVEMPDRLAWYAIRVRPRYEKQVAQSFASKGISTFLPLYSARRRWSDRVKELELPLFDGYVFCQADLNQRMPVLTTPGVIHFVGIGKTPQAVEDHEVEAIQQIVAAGSVARPWPFLREGDRIRIDDGPLRNVEGILIRAGDMDQVVVSVTLLQRSVAVQVDRAWLTPIRVWMRQPASRPPKYLR
jgi:transcription antitermination factor NusG